MPSISNLHARRVVNQDLDEPSEGTPAPTFPRPEHNDTGDNLDASRRRFGLSNHLSGSSDHSNSAEKRYRSDRSYRPQSTMFKLPFGARHLWLALAVINIVFIFTALHSNLCLDDSEDTHEGTSWSALARRPYRTCSSRRLSDYANGSSLVSPSLGLDSGHGQCSMCDASPEVCAEIGQDRMAQALAYNGSGKRLKRVLQKMRAGKPWVMGVIGGSGVSCFCLAVSQA